MRRFLQAQIDSPITGDWILNVQENLAHLDINMSLEEICAMSKSAFKTIVKEALHKKSLEFGIPAITATNAQQIQEPEILEHCIATISGTK